ncbi:MAG: hypothetical protein JSS27_01170 [Planctomycetes bacterium]|nr:hypothetical protein [Planctomycetota bacterium]
MSRTLALSSLVLGLLWSCAVSGSWAAEPAQSWRGRPAENAAAYAKLQTKLNEPTEAEFIESPLSDIVDFFRSKHRLAIHLDRRALEAAGVASDSPLTLNLKDMTLRSALRLALRPLNLSYLICDEVVLITTRDEAYSAGMLQTYVFAVPDFVDAEDHDERSLQATSLIKTLQGALRSQLWVDAEDSITCLEPQGLLVIKAPFDIQQQTDELLQSLRAVRDSHAAAVGDQ